MKLPIPNSCTSLLSGLLLLLFLLSSEFAFAQPSGFVDQVYAPGFTQAVGMTFDANGRMYVYEKNGAVWIVENGVKSANPLIDLSEEVGGWRDFGLLGFALDPDFLVNGYIYLFYIVDRHHLMNFGTPSYNPNTNEYFNATIGRITRYQALASTNFTTVDYNSRVVLFGETASTGFPNLHQSHGTGALVFGTDGTLLASMGDGASYTSVDQGSASETYYVQALADGIIRPDENVGAYRSQMLNSFGGKVIRIDPVTGDGVPSNPHFDAAGPRSAPSRIWARGLRNPCRMTLKPGTGSHVAADGDPGVFFIGDVGWGSREELDVMDGPDLNFGWPRYEGMTLLTDYTNGTYAPANHELAKVDWRNATPRGYINGTIYNIGTSQFPGPTFSGNCSMGGVWYTGTDFPAQYQNTYFHGDYGGDWIKQFGFDANHDPIFGADFKAGANGLVFISTSPVDGGLYYLAGASGGSGNTLNDVRKISYSPGNQPPVAVIHLDKEFGPGPLTVQFYGDQSSDPEGSSLTYSWDFGDGSALNSSANPMHTFSPAGSGPISFTVTLTVTDNNSLTHSTTQVISVNNTPPVIVSTSLDNIFTYGMTSQTQLALNAVVTDAEHTAGQLSYAWQTSLFHGNHSHQETVDPNPSTSTFITPVGCDGILYFYRVELTVTDAVGLSTTYSKDIYPDCGGPVAQNDIVTGDLNQSTGIDVLANDLSTGAAIDPATVIIVQSPSHGTASVNPATGIITYTHTGGSAQDMLTYAVKDVNDNVSGIAAVYLSLQSQLRVEKGILTNVGSTWETVTLNQTFGSMVVVATSVISSQSDLPAVTRIRNAAGNSFEIRVQNPGNQALSGNTVHYIVVEEGVYNQAEHGVKMEAVKALSTVTAENNNWTLEPRSYQQPYGSPVVMGQVMTYNDAGWSTFYATGALRQDVPSSSSFAAGKHVGEDTDITRNDETIGYLVFESGSGMLNEIPFDAAQGPNTVAGVPDSPTGYGYALNGVSNPAVAILGNTGENGGNGKWSVLFGANPLSATELRLAVDEDQVGDIERNHTTEEVAYLILGKQDQTISFDAIPDKDVADGPFTVNASASSGLPVSFSIVSGPATVSGNTVTLSGIPGFVTVRAVQAGDLCYTAATPVDQTFEVTEDMTTSYTISSQVVMKSDDAEENTGSGFVSTSSSDLELAHDGSRIQVIGIRFTDIDVPPGATITNSYIQFTVDETDTGPVNLTIHGEDVDDATTFVSAMNDISSRTKTTASVSWSPPAWNTVGEVGPDQQTSDIATIIQEIIERPGWQQDNALNILIDGSGTRTAEAYGNNPSIAAKLFITFEVAGGLPNIPPVVVLDATPTSGSVALSVAFDGNSSTDSDGMIVGYDWDLGDGTISSLSSLSHLYTLPGTYPVSLVVTDDEGASDTAYTSITVLDTTNLVQTSSAVSQESDDAEENINSGFVSTTSSDLELGFDGTRQQLVGIRFNNLAIPPDATISNAYVQFMVDEPDSSPTFVNIRGEDVDNALTFQAVDDNISSRPLTSAVVSWAPAPWVTAGDNGPDQQTPNIASVIQEIVDRPGWTINSSLALVIDGTGERTAEDHNPTSPEGPILYVTYEPSTGPSSRTAKRIDAEFYPNPFENEFYIRITSKDVAWVDVRVTNVLGQTLIEGVDFKTDQLITVGADLPAGVYIVQVTSGDRFEDFKIVKK